MAETSPLFNHRLGYGLVAALYLLTFPYHPKLRSPNELCRLWQARSLVEDHTLSINGALQRYGYVGDLSRVGNLFYPSKAPLLSFLAAPIYAAIKGQQAPSDVVQVYWSRLFLLVIPSLVFLRLLRKFLLAYFEPQLADPVVWTYALGSMAFGYSEIFMSHQLTAILCFSAFYLAWSIVRGERKPVWWLAAGAATGASVAAEYTAALTVLGVAAYVVIALWKDKPKLLAAVGLVILGAAPFLGGLMAYHQVCYGSPFESGYKNLNDAGYQHWHVGGFLGIRIPYWDAFAFSFFSPRVGLFIVLPWLWVVGFGFKQLRALDRPLFWFTVVLFGLNLYFTSAFDHTSWGWTLGPRHLTPLMPFLALPLALALKGLKESPRKWLFGAAAGACGLAVVTTGALSLVNYIPDSVSNAFFGLTVPLFDSGYLPPTILAVFGSEAMLPGALLLLGLALGAVGVTAWLFRGEPSGQARYGAAGFAVAFLVLLGAITRHDAGDTGGFEFMKSVWLIQPPKPDAPAARPPQVDRFDKPNY